MSKADMGPASPPPPEMLRQWWHEILRNYGKYSCYATFLILPSDIEAIRYLISFGEELNLISGKDCLVLILSEDEFVGSGMNARWLDSIINEHISSGYSLNFAKVLKISLTEFPCLVVFNDIRSSDYVLIPLKGLSAEIISQKMREIITVIQEAVSKKEKPTVALKRHQNIETLRNNSWATINTIFSFAGKTFEKAMEAWMSTIIK